MKPMTHPEIEALRRRWREILKRAQEKAEHPSPADIEAANASNDPVVAELLAQTTKALEEHSKRLLNKLKPSLNDFSPSATEQSNRVKQFIKRISGFR